MQDTSTSHLAELIAKRRKCLTQLRDLGARQSELIADGNMGALLRLLAAKHELIVALEALEKQLSPYQDQDPESRRWPSAEARARCAADAEECQRLLAEVMAIEQAGERQMIVRRDGVAQALRALNSAGKVHAAYEANR